ncbi:MAG: hypothetical protein NBV65_00045 [Burkholderiaceae bacterium]|nr:hypothetical protein [Burkholderiaceae bacterium]
MADSTAPATDAGASAPLTDGGHDALAPWRESLARVLLTLPRLMIRHAPPDVAKAFVASRCGAANGRVYGTLSAAACGKIIDRAWPM